MNVPPRWLHCPRRGNLVAGKFLPFKTPLSAKYNRDVPEECRCYFISIKPIMTVFMSPPGGTPDLIPYHTPAAIFPCFPFIK